jgi:hypothetical protein
MYELQSQRSRAFGWHLFTILKRCDPNLLNPLPLRPAPVQRETVPSFLSRIAAVNGVSAKDFQKIWASLSKGLFYLRAQQ